jgi:hypothetical protein
VAIVCAGAVATPGNPHRLVRAHSHSSPSVSHAPLNERLARNIEALHASEVIPTDFDQKCHCVEVLRLKIERNDLG